MTIPVLASSLASMPNMIIMGATLVLVVAVWGVFRTGTAAVSHPDVHGNRHTDEQLEALGTKLDAIDVRLAEIERLLREVG